MTDYQKLYRLDGKVALVTGAARGIGAEVARALAQSGARVLITDVLDDQGRRTAAALADAGGQVEFLRHDVVDEAQWEQAVGTAIRRWGGLDVLVNNAGIERMARITDCTVEEFRQVLDVNVVGTFLGCKHAVRAMAPGGAAGRGGSIVNLSSVAGLIGFPGLGAYSAAKGAVRLLSKSVAVECGRLNMGIRVNSVHPGLVQTDMGSDLLRHLVEQGFAPDYAAAQAAMFAAHPLGRLGEPLDIAAITLFLASDASRWVTAAEFAVDGGLVAA